MFTHVITGYQADKIHEIDDGYGLDGDKIFIIPKKSGTLCLDDYLLTFVFYGSCTGSNLLLAVKDYEQGLPSNKQVKQLMSLSLHLIQRLRSLGDIKVEEDYNVIKAKDL